MSTARFYIIHRLSLLLFLAGYFGCAQAPAPSPETVVSEYIQYLHAGDFAAAAARCTPAGQAYLNALQAIMTAVTAAPDSSGIRIESLRCSLQADTVATCEAVLDDGFEQYTEQFALRQRTGYWLIHHEPDTGATTITTEDQ